MPDFDTVKRTPFDQLSLDDVVYCHLSASEFISCQDMVLQSFLESAEKEMRMTRRLENTQQYSPLLCGFAILDQIGGVYSDNTKPTPPNRQPAIKKCLEVFGYYQITSDESEALYCLRNCLVHDSALSGSTIGNRTNPSKHFFFRYDWKQATSIMLAKTPWDGTNSNLSHDNITLINPRAFTEEISDILKLVRKIQNTDRSRLVINANKDQILNKYISWRPS